MGEVRETAGPVRRALRPGVTVMVPAWNEEASIADTVRSVLAQSVRPDCVIVVDDCSTDNTGAVAAALGVKVVRPPVNRGSKASALNYGLTFIDTELVLAIDADTTLAPDALEKLLPAMDSPEVAAASGFVLPRHVRTVWERGRHVEYLYAFGFYKPIQDYYRKPLIASGCFTIHRTAELLELGGWSQRTVGEDMDLTWTLYERGRAVRHVPGAVCYPIEPHTFSFLSKQLRRWSHGFWQCLRVHRESVLDIPYLRMMVAAALWDSTLAVLTLFVMIPLMALLVHPLFLVLYVADLPAVLVPVVLEGSRRGQGGVWRGVSSIPAFYVLRYVNYYYMIKAFIDEFVVNKPLKTFVKGH
ncbi:MAG: glycosyltransferase family 2 protein [Phycisphaerales bacterium]|nr:glycosyltransferase family 2 protein [Phycisphaerales bacterium]